MSIFNSKKAYFIGIRVYGTSAKIFFIAIKAKSATKEYQSIEQKMLNLTQKKHLNLTAKVTRTLLNGYHYTQNTKILEQQIKVLNMKLKECQRRQ